MTADARTTVGVDVGGTNIRAARVNRTGKLLEHKVEPVEADRQGFTTQLLRLVGQVADSQTVGVGIGIPGRVDAKNGIICSTGYLDIAGLNLPGLIQKSYGLPTKIENDAVVALIAEVLVRPEMSGRLALMVTVGTGIGGAIIQDGTPWHGGGISGQFGHLVVSADGPRCNCGRRGCVETFSSGTALRRLIADSGFPEDLSASMLTERAQDGDKTAIGILKLWAKPVQRALETLTSAFDPWLIVIGGGLGKDMAAALTRIDNESTWFDLPVEPAILGDNAGVIGAGLLCFPKEAP